jgi:hypothetical protein
VGAREGRPSVKYFDTNLPLGRPRGIAFSPGTGIPGTSLERKGVEEKLVMHSIAIAIIGLFVTPFLMAAPDFNQLIQENNKISDTLHESLRKSIDPEQGVTAERKKEVVVVETGDEVVNVTSGIRKYPKEASRNKDKLKNSKSLLENEFQDSEQN